jgi:hypothetical protein
MLRIRGLRASWFETRGFPALLTMRFGGTRDHLVLRRRKAASRRMGDKTTAATTPRSRHAHASEFCIKGTLEKERGRRKGRVHAAPAVSCADARKDSAHEHTGSAEAIRPSLREWFYGLYRALLGDEFLLVTVVTRISGAIGPVGPRLRLRGLNTSNGCQDHTALPYASCVARLARRVSLTRINSPCDPLFTRATPKRPPHPALHVRDDAYAPLIEAGQPKEAIDLGAM